MTFEKVQISGKYFAEISDVGETPNFVEFTQEEINSDNYSKIGVKSFKLDGDIVANGIATNTDGKIALVDATKTAAVEYLETIFTDSANQHDVKVFVMRVERKEEDDEIVTETGNYVAKNDIMNVDARFEVHVVPVALLIDSVTITELNTTDFELKVNISNDLIDVVRSVGVVFDSYSGPEPQPDAWILSLSTPNVAGAKSFLDATLTFGTPAAAVGGDYTLIIELRDAQSQVLKTEEITVTVQGI